MTGVKRVESLNDSPYFIRAIADIAAAPFVDRVERLGMADLWRTLPGVTDWVARLTARPAYRKAMPPDAFRLPAAVTG